MSFVKRVVGSRPFQQTAGVVAAEYLRLVWKTTRFVIEPEGIYERFARDAPVIIAMWHGQHFLIPFIKRDEDCAKVLISRHRDGEVNALAAERLGVGAIRGSGHLSGGFIGKGGVSAFKEMLSALEQGCNVALTADIPKVARVAGLGIIKLASASGRPIYPIAIATRRRVELDNWDRTAINLPFGRGGRVAGDPVRVPPDADAEMLEAARRALESSLDAATARAYAIADGPRGDRSGA
ncbi:MAG TPA: lysophospholipid acyltransferase family protein [Xanthobacteraceae bacterium]|nr:lysophospholipid acyltransferase family protein [Xanthobacteraceae bacterium]